MATLGRGTSWLHPPRTRTSSTISQYPPIDYPSSSGPILTRIISKPQLTWNYRFTSNAPDLQEPATFEMLTSPRTRVADFDSEILSEGIGGGKMMETKSCGEDIVTFDDERRQSNRGLDTE